MSLVVLLAFHSDPRVEEIQQLTMQKVVLEIKPNRLVYLLLLETKTGSNRNMTACYKTVKKLFLLP